MRDLTTTLCGTRRKALFQEGGLEIWGKILKGTLRSSAFLGLYCTLCWRGACVGFQATKSASPPVIAASAWTGAHGELAAVGSTALLHPSPPITPESPPLPANIC